jgi:hypothetical protein
MLYNVCICYRVVNLLTINLSVTHCIMPLGIIAASNSKCKVNIHYGQNNRNNPVCVRHIAVNRRQLCCLDWLQQTSGVILQEQNLSTFLHPPLNPSCYRNFNPEFDLFAWLDYRFKTTQHTAVNACIWIGVYLYSLELPCRGCPEKRRNN